MVQVPKRLVKTHMMWKTTAQANMKCVWKATAGRLASLVCVTGAGNCGNYDKIVCCRRSIQTRKVIGMDDEIAPRVPKRLVKMHIMWQTSAQANTKRVWKATAGALASLVCVAGTGNYRKYDKIVCCRTSTQKHTISGMDNEIALRVSKCLVKMHMLCHNSAQATLNAIGK